MHWTAGLELSQCVGDRPVNECVHLCVRCVCMFYHINIIESFGVIQDKLTVAEIVTPPSICAHLVLLGRRQEIS